MTSGYATAKQVDAMLAAGALGFLRKPYELDEFLDTVRRVLGPDQPVKPS